MTTNNYSEQVRKGILSTFLDLESKLAEAQSDAQANLVTKSHSQEDLAISSERRDTAAERLKAAEITNSQALQAALDAQSTSELATQSMNQGKAVIAAMATAAANAKAAFEALGDLNGHVSFFKGNSEVQTKESQLNSGAQQAKGATQKAFDQANELVVKSMAANVAVTQTKAPDVSTMAQSLLTDIQTVQGQAQAMLSAAESGMATARTNLDTARKNASQATTSYVETNGDRQAQGMALSAINRELNGSLAAEIWTPSNDSDWAADKAGETSGNDKWHPGFCVSVTPPERLIVPPAPVPGGGGGKDATKTDTSVPVMSVWFTAVARSAAASFGYLDFIDVYHDDQSKDGTNQFKRVVKVKADGAKRVQDYLKYDSDGNPLDESAIGKTYCIFAFYSPNESSLPTTALEGFNTYLSLPTQPITYEYALNFYKSGTLATDAAPQISIKGGGDDGAGAVDATSVIELQFDYKAFSTCDKSCDGSYSSYVSEYRVFFVQKRVYEASKSRDGLNELFLADMLTPAYYTTVANPPSSGKPNDAIDFDAEGGGFKITFDPDCPNPSYTDMFGQVIDLTAAEYVAFVLAVAAVIKSSPTLPHSAANILSAPSNALPSAKKAKAPAGGDKSQKSKNG